MNHFFYLKKQIVFCSLLNSGATYVDNKMLRQMQNFSVCHGNASAKKKKKTAGNLSETFVYHVRYGFGMPQHFTKDCDLVF